LLLGVLLKKQNTSLGILTIILGVGSLLDSAGTIIGEHVLSSVGLFVYLILAPVWGAALGIVMVRDS
jgi:hypothetical protein